MPLLKRKPFTPAKLPKDLKPNEEVFVCRHTNEVYRDYESFFKRTILCNSLVWSCRLTGKSGLTYQEAEESEQGIVEFAESLPVPIQRAALTLVHHTQRGRLANLCDEVFFYLKDRFQEGEEVEVQHTGKRRKGVIERVIEPDELPNGIDDSMEQKSSTKDICSPNDKNKSIGTPEKRQKQGIGDKNTHIKSYKDIRGSNKSSGKARTSSESENMSRKASAEETTTNKGSKLVLASTKDKMSTPKGSKPSSNTPDADVIIIDDGNDGKNIKKDKAVGTLGSPKTKVTYNWQSSQGYRYEVKLASTTKNSKKNADNKQKEDIMVVDADCLSRKKGAFTRDKLKNFLKLSCIRSTVSSEDGFYIVEDDYRKKFQLGDIQFADSLKLDSPPTKSKGTKRKKRNKSSTEDGDNTGEARKKIKRNEGDPGKKSKTGKDGNEKCKKYSNKKLTPEERLKLLEDDKEKKQQQVQEEKEKKRLQRERDRAIVRAKKEDEKVQRKLKRDKERGRLRDQKKQEALWYREWSKPREDLQLDDLKELPTPIPVKVKLPSHLFGDAVMVLEFLGIFGTLFDMKDDFPTGISFAMIEEALTEHDVEGVYYELLQFLLGAILRTHMDEEEDEGLAHTDDTKTALPVDDEDDHRTAVSASAAMAAVWPLLHQGKPLHELIMDPFTCTELLRLHLLSSGARLGCDDYRWQSRGGFTYADDPGVEFRHQETGIMKDLITGTVYDLSVENKLKILMVLSGQLLTYVISRDYIEEGFEKIKKTRREWLSEQWKEQRREKEEAAAKYKRKIEEKARQKGELEKRKSEKEGGDIENKDSRPQVENRPADLVTEVEDAKEFKKTNSRKIPEEPKPHEQESNPNDKAKDHTTEMETTLEKPDLSIVEEEQRALETKRERQQREKEYLEELHKSISMSNIQPLGRDRMYRRFWMFRCLKGLFIEDDDPELPHYLETIVEEESEDEESSIEENADDEAKKITAQNEDTPPVIDLTSDNDDNAVRSDNKESQTGINERKLNKGINKYIKEGNIICDIPKQNELKELEILNNVKSVSARNITQWSFIGCPEDLDSLISSLNPRGFREHGLREALQHDYKRLVTSIEKCPFREVNIIHKKELKLTPRGRRMRGQQGIDKSQYSNMEDFVKASLRDQILELEDRVWQGGLGIIKEEDREAWRARVEDGIYDQFKLKSDEDNLKTKETKGENEEHVAKVNEDGISCKEARAEKKDESDTMLHANGNKYIFEPMDKDEVSTLKRESTHAEIPMDMNGDIKADNADAEPELVKVEDTKPSLFLAIPRLKLDLSSKQALLPPVESRSGTPIKSLMPASLVVNPAVRELALALLKVEQGIDAKYLSPPLGEDEETKRQRQKEAVATALEEYNVKMTEGKEKKSNEKKNFKKVNESGDDNERKEDGNDGDSNSSCEEQPQKVKTVLERWEESLMSCTSLSQVFVHLNTLDGSISWSKSVLNARCKLCRRKGDAEKMLLCDACDRGHHMYCLKPPIKKVPEGNWFCPDCRPKEPHHSGRRLKVIVDEDEESAESSEEESDSNEESNSDTEEYEHSDEEEEEKESESEHGDTCAVCSEVGELLCCDICPLAYHVQCAYPPLRRVPRGNWACQVCTGADEDCSSKTRVKKVTIKAALKKAKEKQTPTKFTKRLTNGKNSLNKKCSPSPSPPMRGRSRTGNAESAQEAKRQNIAVTLKSSKSFSPAGKGSKHNPVSLRIRGQSSLDLSCSPSPACKIQTWRDPRLTGRLLKCERLLMEVMEHEGADHFLDSGSHHKHSDYRSQIENPIDLGTIKKKLDDNKYDSVDEFLSDVRKVFIDCAEYCKPRSKEAKAGARLSTFFETKFSDMGLDSSACRKVRSCRRT